MAGRKAIVSTSNIPFGRRYIFKLTALQEIRFVVPVQSVEMVTKESMKAVPRYHLHHVQSRIERLTQGNIPEIVDRGP